MHLYSYVVEEALSVFQGIKDTILITYISCSRVSKRPNEDPILSDLEICPEHNVYCQTQIFFKLGFYFKRFLPTSRISLHLTVGETWDQLQINRLGKLLSFSINFRCLKTALKIRRRTKLKL